MGEAAQASLQIAEECHQKDWPKWILVGQKADRHCLTTMWVIDGAKAHQLYQIRDKQDAEKAKKQAKTPFPTVF